MNVDEREVPIYAGWADSMVSIADVIGLPIVCPMVIRPGRC
jgi:hypothetical protein